MFEVFIKRVLQYAYDVSVIMMLIFSKIIPKNKINVFCVNKNNLPIQTSYG